METFIIGTSEAIEDEFGATVDAPWVLVTFFDGEIQDVIPFASKEAAKEELNWVEDRKTISYL